MLEKRFKVKKFYIGLVTQARIVFQQVRMVSETWLRLTLDPIVARIQEHKAQLEHRLESISMVHANLGSIQERKPDGAPGHGVESRPSSTRSRPLSRSSSCSPAWPCAIWTVSRSRPRPDPQRMHGGHEPLDTRHGHARHPPAPALPPLRQHGFGGGEDAGVPGSPSLRLRPG